MYIDNSFKTALIISLSLHGLVLAALPGANFFRMHKKFQKIEITYIKPQLKKTERVVALKKAMPAPYIKKEEVIQENLREINRPEIRISEKKSAQVGAKISLPADNSEKIHNPKYLNYSQTVRERIKRAAYQNYTRHDTGQVYLSFAISSDGTLQAVRLIEEKSVENQYLRGIALKSIQDASPFPKFPKELNYPQLSFNIIISFEAK